MTQTNKRFGASRSFLAAAALGIGLAAASGTASAAYVTASFDSTYGGTIQRIIEDSDTGSTSWASINAGLFTMTRTAGDYPGTLLPGLNGTFYALCIEPQQTISQGQTYSFQVDNLENAPGNISGMGVERAGFISQLLYGVQPLTTSLNATQAMALQIAAWEIIRESNVNLSNPDFDVTSGNTRFRNESLNGAMDLANSWLEEFVNGTAARPGVNNVIALHDPQAQDLLALVYVDDNGNEAPAPGTLALLGLGLAGLAGSLRRRR